jgi:hypothetical protein
MLDQLDRAAELSGTGLDSFPDEILAAGRPVVFRQAFADWPFVQAARKSDEAAIDYIEGFYKARPVNMIVAPPSEHGRYFYRSDSKRMNFDPSVQLLPNVLRTILRQKSAAEPHAIAMQALSAPDCLPGLQSANPNPLVPEGTAARLWIGNSATVAPHFDVVDNLACVVAGRRRFILFPPEQTANLYPGPMDVTPAHVPISMVSLDEPDLERFPLYRDALDHAVVAELEPGDAIYIPYLWWHGVQSLAPFNVLMNYWWHRHQPTAGFPYAALLRLVYTAYRDMPDEHRKAWRPLYDHYVFQAGGDPMAALSPAHRDSAPDVDASWIARLKAALSDLLG